MQVGKLEITCTGRQQQGRGAAAGQRNRAQREGKAGANTGQARCDAAICSQLTPCSKTDRSPGLSMDRDSTLQIQTNKAATLGQVGGERQRGGTGAAAGLGCRALGRVRTLGDISE